eukprot:gene21112-32523_t
MSRLSWLKSAWRRPAHELIGFFVGFGGFFYVDRYGVDPPDVVKNNGVLLSGHNGLLYARRQFQNAGKAVWSMWKPSPLPLNREDVLKEVNEARGCYEAKEFAEVAGKLRHLFLTSGTEAWVTSGMLDEEACGWIFDAVPALSADATLNPVEATIMLNWLYRSERARAEIAKHPAAYIDLPARILREGSGTDLLLACSLLTHTAAALESLAAEGAAGGLPEARGGSFLDRIPFFGGKPAAGPAAAAAPANAAVEELMRTPEAVGKVVACLDTGVEFPALLLELVAKDPRHRGRVVDGGAAQAVTRMIIQKFSNLETASQSVAGDLASAPTLLATLATLAEHDKALLPLCVPTEHERLQLSDAIFRSVSLNTVDERGAVSGFKLLVALQELGVSNAWLAQKGAVSLAANVLAWHGSDEAAAALLNAFTGPILTDPEAKQHVPDEQLQELAQVRPFQFPGM